MMRRWLSATAFLLLGAPLALAQTPGLTINKQPENLVRRTFDPAKPPADMPPVSPPELAECDSDFLSDASVGGQARQTDVTHATVTITQITVTIQLNITIWDPIKATQHVIDHEEGHRQISETIYQTADKVAQRAAAPYMGKQVVISGTDLHAALSALLQQMGTEITDNYAKVLNPEATQARYDAINDHGRNDVTAADAMAQALKQVPPAGSAN